jgi:hypothetical protein
MKNLLCIDEEMLDAMIEEHRQAQLSYANQQHGAAAMSEQSTVQVLNELKDKMKSCEAVWENGKTCSVILPGVCSTYEQFVSNTKFEEL